MYECMYERACTNRRRARTNASRCLRRVSKSFLRASQGPKISESLSLDTHLVLDVVSTSDVVWQLVRASIRHDEHLRARLGRSVRVGGRQERRCSLFDSRRFSPNTSSVQTCRNRQTFVTCARTHASSCPHGSERQPTCAYRTGEQFSENCESSVQKIFLDFR